MKEVLVPEAILAAIEIEARAEAPRECCGLLGGRGGRALSRYPLRNFAERPETQYWAAPADIFAAMRRMREGGEELIAIYHSHPRGPARPSPTDLELAFHPEAAYLIIALEPRFEARAYRLCGGSFDEVALTISRG